ncbi:MAG TPA: hypothetical protein VND66_02550 [Acidobacteriaceae bacterium]|nr:hypothetical protein [Acidobacteriaceae bacterium]
MSDPGTRVLRTTAEKRRIVELTLLPERVWRGLFREPIKHFVPANASIARVGQPAFSLQRFELSDVVAGALISVKFEPGKDGCGVASPISTLATPGFASVNV